MAQVSMYVHMYAVKYVCMQLLYAFNSQNDSKMQED